jgi:hypothetical protein
MYLLVFGFLDFSGFSTWIPALLVIPSPRITTGVFGILAVTALRTPGNYLILNTYTYGITDYSFYAYFLLDFT